MTLVESAIVLAWIAIALLSAGFAVLVRQTALISRAVPNRVGSGTTPGANPLVGLRLPGDTGLQPWLDGGVNVLALYVSPSCSSCRAYLQACQAEPELMKPDQPVVVLSLGGCPTDVAGWPSNWICIEQAATEHALIDVPAVPYFAIVRSDRLVTSAGLATAPKELVATLNRDGSGD